MRYLLVLFILFSFAADTQSAMGVSPSEWMVQLSVDGEPIEGWPLVWDTRSVHLLARDGSLRDFAPEAAKDFRKTADVFRSYTPSEFRAVLLRELGQSYEVSGTGHYLVAHPRGQRDRWAQRFEDLYRALVHYFSVRGFQLGEPRFPLVAVVGRNRQEFARYSANQGSPVNSGVLGWYSWQSNRILIYDADGGSSSRDNWEETAATLIHEATHQTAFNTGIHSRYAVPPVWVAEGVATLFEAPGVYNSRFHPSRSDRINRGRLRQFQQLVPQHRPELIRDLVASDRLFRASPAAAYAEAWALTFYLVETDARKYAAYLGRTAGYPAFHEIAAEERLADFTTVFGDDWRMLEAKLLRFLGSVK
ncbi:MAG: DUF1570 domain-containing protein [Rhodopirellula sp.]|nr:DUF1570 domain-containing protein [Rhodopirellula sp.]